MTQVLYWSPNNLLNKLNNLFWLFWLTHCNQCRIRRLSIKELECPPDLSIAKKVWAKPTEFIYMLAAMGTRPRSRICHYGKSYHYEAPTLVCYSVCLSTDCKGCQLWPADVNHAVHTTTSTFSILNSKPTIFIKTIIQNYYHQPLGLCI